MKYTVLIFLVMGVVVGGTVLFKMNKNYTVQTEKKTLVTTTTRAINDQKPSIQPNIITAPSSSGTVPTAIAPTPSITPTTNVPNSQPPAQLNANPLGQLKAPANPARALTENDIITLTVVQCSLSASSEKWSPNEPLTILVKTDSDVVVSIPKLVSKQKIDQGQSMSFSFEPQKKDVIVSISCEGNDVRKTITIE